jgi:hypothetical protein
MNLKTGVRRMATGCTAFFLLAAGGSATYTMTSQTWLRNFAKQTHGQPAAVQVMMAWQTRGQLSDFMAHQLNRQIHKCSATAAEENIPQSTRNYARYLQRHSVHHLTAGDIVFDRCLHYAISNDYPEITAPLRQLTTVFLACSAISGLILLPAVMQRRKPHQQKAEGTPPAAAP